MATSSIARWTVRCTGIGAALFCCYVLGGVIVEMVFREEKQVYDMRMIPRDLFRVAFADHRPVERASYWIFLPYGRVRAWMVDDRHYWSLMTDAVITELELPIEELETADEEVDPPPEPALLLPDATPGPLPEIPPTVSD